MKTWTDNRQRTWVIEINVTTLKRIRDLAGVDLLEAIEGDVLERLIRRPDELAAVLYAACQPAADTAGVTPENFGEGLAGDAIDAATEALLADLVAFFPRARRAVIDKAVAKVRHLEAMTYNAAERALDSPELEALLAAELSDLEIVEVVKRRLNELRSYGPTSTDSPAKPAATPDPAPPAS